jgi:hypothetical protein
MFICGGSRFMPSKWIGCTSACWPKTVSRGVQTFEFALKFLRIVAAPDAPPWRTVQTIKRRQRCGPHVPFGNSCALMLDGFAIGVGNCIFLGTKVWCF